MTDRSAVENHSKLYGKDIIERPGYWYEYS
jgi:hypothetical protein